MPDELGASPVGDRRIGRWIRIGVIGGLVVLVFGRWLAVWSADHWWAEALGAEAAHGEILRLRISLYLLAFLVALAWAAGNLYVVYRSIGSVHVPRRLANIEIVEALPRKYLTLTVVVLSVVIGVALSYNTGSWWAVQAVADTPADEGLRDPILNRSIGYYLFWLPWERALHGYAVLCTAVLLGVSLVLHTAVGAVRVQGRRLDVSGLARRHLGLLLALFAASLVWGYRLEPVEYVAGIHDVPWDTVLTDVRFPTSRLLGALGLMTVVTSLLWMRYDRVAILAFGWIALGTFSLVGHYVVPSVAAGARTPDELRIDGLSEREQQLTAFAFGLSRADTGVAITVSPRDTAVPASGVPVPVWDAFAATTVMNRVADDSGRWKVQSVSLGRYGRGEATAPVYVGVAETDLAAARTVAGDLTWEQIHVGEYARPRAAYAMRADVVKPDGLPAFVPDPAHPDSTSDVPVAIDLVDADISFGPATTEYLVSTAEARPGLVAVPLTNWFRRVVLGWRLQSLDLLRWDRGEGTATVVWFRSVAERLRRYTPFATFGNPVSVVNHGRLTWIALGYVSRPAFPLSPRTRWQGRSARFVRAGFVGVVDAATGQTAVYLLPGADPLSVAWSERFPSVVAPSDAIPVGIRSRIPYPLDLFRLQQRVIAGPEPARTLPSFFRRRPLDPAGGLGEQPFWWAADRPTGGWELQLRAAIERGDPPVLDGFVEAAVRDGQPIFTVREVRSSVSVTGPTRVQDELVGDLGNPPYLPGPLKTVALGSAVAFFQAHYSDEPNEIPRLIDVTAKWGAGLGQGPTLEAALRRARDSTTLTAEPAGDWVAAQRWFQRLDDAIRAADWAAFGQAYNELKRLLGGPDAVR